MFSAKNKKMNPRILTSLLLIVSSTLLSQGTRFITLKDDSENKLFTNFNITKVSDDRQTKENIGVFNVGIFNSKKDVKFKNGLETTIKNYLDNIAIASDSLTRIQISVLKFEVSEVSTKKLGTVDVHFEFLAEDEEGWYVYKDFSKTISDSLMIGNHSERHEARIRKVLKASIQYLNSKDTVEVEKPTPIINQNKCSPITLDNNLFKYQNRSFKTIDELKKVLLDCGNEEVVKMFKNYQRNYKLSNIAAIAGGGIFGYQAGAWLVSREMNEPVFFSALAISIYAIIMEYKSKRKVKEIIDVYNVFIRPID